MLIADWSVRSLVLSRLTAANAGRLQDRQRARSLRGLISSDTC